MSDSGLVPASNLVPDFTSDTEGTVPCLLVKLAERDYGVRLATLQEVLRYQPGAVAPVPNTPEWLEGVYSLRGLIISVVSLRLFFGFPYSDATDSLTARLEAELFGIGAQVPRLLVLHHEEIVVGVVVDDIRGVLFVRPEGIKPAGNNAPYLEGVYTDPQTGQTTQLLDTARLLTSPELLVFEPVM